MKIEQIKNKIENGNKHTKKIGETAFVSIQKKENYFNVIVRDFFIPEEKTEFKNIEAALIFFKKEVLNLSFPEMC